MASCESFDYGEPNPVKVLMQRPAAAPSDFIRGVIHSKFDNFEDFSSRGEVSKDQKNINIAREQFCHAVYIQQEFGIETDLVGDAVTLPLETTEMPPGVEARVNELLTFEPSESELEMMVRVQQDSVLHQIQRRNKRERRHKGWIEDKIRSKKLSEIERETEKRRESARLIQKEFGY